MQRQRNSLVPVAEALADLPGPVKAISREPAPQARHSFTLGRSGGPVGERPAKRTPT